MFFKNIIFYRMEAASNLEAFFGALAALPLNPCGTTDLQSIGWVSPCGDGSFVRSVNGKHLIALGVEQKILPASVVKQFADDKAKEIEESQGRKVGRKELRELRESATIELLPRAFVRRRTTFGYLDQANGFIVINASTPAKAEEFLGYLRKTIEAIPASLVKVNKTPSQAMTAWVSTGDAPAGFTIDQDLRLQSPEKAQVTYSKHTLEGDDIRHQIEEGKVATKLALTWGEKISFVLTESLSLKRVYFLDILKEQNEQQAENKEELFDLDFALMAGEMAILLSDLLAALGGEFEG